MKRLGELQEDLVLVLGPPSYFPKFGFDAELAKKVHGPYAGAAFMAAPLTEAGSNNLPIEVTFATPFEEFE
jgi:putative acetyltransferase